MQIIGLTGGIACGKSTVASLLHKKYNLLLIDGDKISTRLYEEMNINGRFGVNSKEELSKLVFKDKEIRKALQDILHPAIIWQVAKTVIWCFCIGTPIVVIEAPLLFEVGLEKWVSKIITVTCSKNTRIHRLVGKKHISSKEALLRIQSQLPLSFKVQKSTFIIENNGTLKELEKNVDNLYLEITQSYSRVTHIFIWIFTLALIIIGVGFGVNVFICKFLIGQ